MAEWLVGSDYLLLIPSHPQNILSFISILRISPDSKGSFRCYPLFFKKQLGPLANRRIRIPN